MRLQQGMSTKMIDGVTFKLENTSLMYNLTQIIIILFKNVNGKRFIFEKEGFGDRDKGTGSLSLCLRAIIPISGINL